MPKELDTTDLDALEASAELEAYVNSNTMMSVVFGVALVIVLVISALV